MKRYLIILMLAFAASSCDKFLDEGSGDRLPADAAVNTLDDLYLNAVAARYADVGGHSNSVGLQGTGRGVYDLNTFTTDEAVIPTRGADWYDGGLWQNLYLHRFAGLDPIGDTWNYLLRAIMGCNASLEDIRSFKATNPNVDVSQYEAEVTALRAMFYFYVLDLYGRAPLFSSSEPKASELALWKRSEVMRMVVNNLTAAEPLLPNVRSNTPGQYYGRMTRPVAQFLIAKIMLNAEVYADDDWTDNARPDGKDILWLVNGTTMNTWEACAYYCKQLENIYSLESDFSANFAVNNENSVENIFTIPMNKYLYTNQFIYLFRSRHYNHASALGLNGENGPCATPTALRAFGLPEGSDTPSADTDPRFALTYYSGPVKDLQGKMVTLDDGTPLVYKPWAVQLNISGTEYEKTAGARMAKYEVDPTGTKDGNQSDNDIVLFRFADVLLMHCEALLRNGQAGAEADALLNHVRARVGAKPMTASLDMLLDERLRELAWEGWRRNDLIRFNRFTEPYALKPAQELDNHRYSIVFPIPGVFLSVSQSPQNPGY